MGDTRARLVHFATCALVSLLIAGFGFLVINYILRYRAQRNQADEHARQNALDREAKLVSAAELQVWAAGARGPDGKFCSPCSLNPTMIYQTSDPAEVREFVSKFRFRRTVPKEPEVANCGPITIDFLRDAKIIHSANLKPTRLAGW
jgi:hypothetical protein